MKEYDVIVVGGGHAGMEAAFAAAHMGLNTLLLTLNKKMMANMPCNPSIGGSAKGIVVREIDALGGMMGKAADHEYLQMKMLNTGKGPGVQCLRCQADKIDYPAYMQYLAMNTENLTIAEEMVVDLLHDDSKVYGVITTNGQYESQAVILTTGTYMESEILVGHEATVGGPDGEKSARGLSLNLQKMGIEIFRLKTGTPQRIKAESIDFSILEPQYGTQGNLAFSYETDKFIPLEDQIVCYLTYTNEKTHQIIRDNLHKSAMYGGIVKGVGPRYCPSIEDKIVRFADKPRHQLFLEPESRKTNSIYLQGFSTSMPKEVQEKMVHSLKGLEHAEILKYAYAIEYDAIVPLQFDHTLQIKKWPGLYCAGQICGTSGYEEAAGLGLMAGINASLKILGKDPLILRRDEAYIGVMIDDLVLKGTNEPYRLLSSRAEYRLLIRHDNADLRLTEYGHQIGLISEQRYAKFCDKKAKLEENEKILRTTFLTDSKALLEYLQTLGYSDFKAGTSAANLLKRPLVKYSDIKQFVQGLNELDEIGMMQLEVIIKYEGYIEKQKREAERLIKMENIEIPDGLDFDNLDGLALEARQKLSKFHPKNIAEASRISGINPSDIAMLLIYVRRFRDERNRI